MKQIFFTMLMVPISGCANVESQSATQQKAGAKAPTPIVSCYDIKTTVGQDASVLAFLKNPADELFTLKLQKYENGRITIDENWATDLACEKRVSDNNEDRLICSSKKTAEEKNQVMVLVTPEANDGSHVVAVFTKTQDQGKSLIALGLTQNKRKLGFVYTKKFENKDDNKACKFLK